MDSSATDRARLRDRVSANVDALQSEIVAVRRHLHAHPELSGRETKTVQYLVGRLEAEGLEPRIVADGCGVIVDSPGESDGPRIALRADIDALPIADAKDVAYRSQHEGVMHACGHDAHAASVLGAALAMHQMHTDGDMKSPVPWRAIFQPAEETNTGALAMVEAGALDGVGSLLSLHMDPSRAAGTIGTRPGPFTADCDEMVIRIGGRGGHASRPHESVDPIAAAAQLISTIYLSVPRRTDSHDPVVVTIGRIAGGHSYNVIPDRVDLLGTVRSFNPTARHETHVHIRELAIGIGQITGTSIEVTFNDGPPSVINDAALNEHLCRVASELLGHDAVRTIARPSMGGEDFAHYLAHVPGCMFRCGCAPPDADAPAPALHNPAFDIDESALSVGAKVLAVTALCWAPGGTP